MATSSNGQNLWPEMGTMHTKVIQWYKVMIKWSSNDFIHTREGYSKVEQTHADREISTSKKHTPRIFKKLLVFPDIPLGGGDLSCLWDLVWWSVRVKESRAEAAKDLGQSPYLLGGQECLSDGNLPICSKSFGIFWDCGAINQFLDGTRNVFTFASSQAAKMALGTMFCL